MFEHYEKNILGKDYAVGDLHGCYSLLEARLKQIGFNPETDRLFSVGDLVDRGAESYRVEEFLEKPWFHAVQGNHDRMAIDYTRGRCNVNLYKSNGGTWFINSDLETRERIAKSLAKLPIALEVETDKGLIGIVHADCPYTSWSTLMNMLQSGMYAPHIVEHCQWDRDRIQYRDSTNVEGLYKLIVGHTPVTDVLALGNLLYIDTGAVYGKKLTIIDFDVL
jgi:serine/threonine protein phosphatase 1